VSKEALLMRVNKEAGRDAQERSRCQIGHVPGKAPSSCAESPKEMVDGLVLCEKHALETKLEGQIECWGEMLFHIDLWSREARRRERPDVVGLLEDQRVEAMSARNRAYADLDVLRKSETSRSETSWGEVLSGREELFRRGSLPLPPKAARPPSRGLRRHRRR
jgi:hypothetical protein